MYRVLQLSLQYNTTCVNATFNAFKIVNDVLHFSHHPLSIFREATHQYIPCDRRLCFSAEEVLDYSTAAKEGPMIDLICAAGAHYTAQKQVAL